MHHPPHSPDLEPSDYHLFANLNKHLCGQRFSTDDELQYATEEWLKEQSNVFHCTGIEKTYRYKLHIDKGNDGVEE